MRESAYAIAMGVAVFSGCDRRSDPQGPADPARNSPTSPSGGGSGTSTAAPGTILAGRPEPSQADRDRAIEKSIRAALVAANLSANAKDCQITVESGRVTLRGSADSQDEKNTVERIARTTRGVSTVTNELKVNQ